MRKTVFLLLFLAGCADKDPLPFNPKDAAQLEGLWRNDAQMSMPRIWYWHFSDGRLYRQSFDFGQIVVEHFDAYETRADSLFLRSMIDPEKQTAYTVYFETDSTATLTDAGAMKIKTYLKRF